MRNTGARLLALCGTLIVAAGLIGLTGCDDDDDVINNPGGGGGAADIDVTGSTPASGNTNISGTGVTVDTTLEDADTTLVQVDANTGGNLRQVRVYFTTATGAVEDVTYSWGTLSLLDNTVYCPAAGCTGVTVNTTTQEISFAGTALDNHGSPNPGDPATKFATLGFAVPASLIQYPNP